MARAVKVDTHAPDTKWRMSFVFEGQRYKVRVIVLLSREDSSPKHD
jgi:hypothetical protein